MLCLVFSIAGISAVDVEDNAIVDDSGVVSDVAVSDVSEDVDDVAVSDVSEGATDADAADSGNITDDVQTNDADNDDASDSDDVSGVVDGKKSEVLTATHTDVLGRELPNFWTLAWNGVTFSGGRATAHWWGMGTSWDDDDLVGVQFIIDDVVIHTESRIDQDEPEGGYSWDYQLPTSLKLTPGQHTSRMTGYDEDSEEYFDFARGFTVTDSVSTFNPNINKQKITYGESITVKPEAVYRNYGDINPSAVTYSVYVDNVARFTNVALSTEREITGLTAGTHKIKIELTGSYYHTATYEYSVTVNKANVIFNIDTVLASVDDPNYKVTPVTTTLDGNFLAGTIILAGEEYDAGTTITIDKKAGAGTYTYRAYFRPSNENYNNATCSFVIDVSQSNFRVITPSYDYGQEVIFYINSTKTGTILVTNLYGTQTYKTVQYTTANEYLPVSMGIMPVGEYNYVVKFEDETYQRVANIFISKAAPDVEYNIPYEVSTYLDSNFVWANTTSYNITGEFVFYLDGEVIGAGPLNGSFADLSTVEAGTHTVNVVYEGDDNYQAFNGTLSLNVVPMEIESSIAFIPVSYPNVPIASFNTNVGYGNYTFYINGKNFTFTANGNIIVFNLWVIPAGTYTLTNITYSDSKNYVLDFEPMNFTIEKGSPELIIDYPVESAYGSEKSITTTTSFDGQNITGKIYYIEDDLLIAERQIGEPLDISDYAVGDYTYSVYYEGDTNYYPVEKEIQFSVKKADAILDLTPVEIKYTYEGEELTVNATGDFEYDGSGILTYTSVIFLNDSFVIGVSAVDAEGNAITEGKVDVYEFEEHIGSANIGETITYNGTERGDRHLRFEFTADNYNSFNQTVIINVEDGEVGLIVDDVVYSEEAIASIIVSKPGIYVVKVGDDTYTVEVFNRSYIPTVSLGILPAKEADYTVTINAEGEQRFFQTTFHVYKSYPILNATQEVLGDDMVITVVGDNYNLTGDVEFYLNGELVHTMTYGEIYNITDYAFGQYDFTIKYVNDPNYEDDVTSLLVERKLPATVEVSVSDIDYGEVEEITITSSNDGYVLLTVGENTYKVTVFKGKAVLNLTNLPAGTYEVKAVIDDAIYYGFNNTSFEVFKSYIDVDVEVDDVIYGDDAVITFTSPVDGTYDVSVGMYDYTVDIVDGHGTLTVDKSVLDIGEYAVIIEKITADMEATGESYFEVFYNSPFTVEIDDYTYNKTGTITVTSDNDGVFTVSIYDGTTLVKTYDVTVTDGIGTLVIPDTLDVAHYDVECDFLDSEGYHSYDFTEFDVVKADPNIIVTVPGEVNYGEDITVEISSAVSGNVIVTFNGKPYTVVIDPDTLKGILTIDECPVPGVYELFAEYDTENYYGNATKEVSVKFNAVIDGISIVDYTYGDSSDLTITTQTPGTYHVYIDGIEYASSIVVADGETTGSVLITGIDAGRHRVFVMLFDASTVLGANTTFNVAQAVRNVNVTVENVPYSVDPVAIVEANEDGSYTIVINGEEYNVIVSGGTGSVTIDGILYVGTYEAVVTIDNPNYVATNSTTFTVSSRETAVNITVSDSTYGDAAIVTVYAEIDGTYKVTFNNLDEAVYVDVDGGVGSREVYGLNIESNSAVVTIEDGNYTATNSTTFTVSPRQTAVNITVSDITYGDSANVTVYAEVDGEYRVTFNNLEGIYTVTVTGGVGSILVGDLNGDSNSATVTINNPNYVASNSTTFTVSPLGTKITASNVAKVYNVPKNYVVYLKDVNGNAVANAIVTVKIGTNTYNRTTNANGAVTIAIANLKPATYTTTIKFAGNSNYAASSLTTSKITVSKATPKMTAPNKTFKLSVKTKKYVVTMKTNKNKVLKGASVSIKVNGKTFTAKTNAKGQATFKLTNLKKKGSFKAVVTFKQTAYYKAVTKKPKIVVK